MELDNIKQRTTWNDASSSINSNFMKVRQAILALQSEGGGLDEAELEEYLTSQGYTKEEWVLAQNALLEKRIDTLEKEGGAVNVGGSEFVNVGEDGTISLEIDPQGGLGATEQGLGIVDIPSNVLKDIKIEVDSAMSDTSENAVSNKVIKKYVDDADNALAERINALEQNSGGGASVEVDAELSESSTNAVANKAVTMAIVEDEEVTAAALNELNERVSNAATKEELAAALIDVGGKIQNAKDVIDASIIDNEEVAAAALVDLDKRLKGILTILGNAGLM